MQFVTLALLWLAATVGPVRAETWYLDQQASQWKELSKDARQALIRADKFYSRDNLTKAARSYNKFLAESEPGTELYKAALERQFAIAEQFLAGRKIRVLGLFRVTGYATGVKLMERITQRAGDSQIAVESVVAVARHYEQRGRTDRENYDLAYIKWQQVFEDYDHQLQLSEPYPTGQLGKDALLGMARCRQLLYRGPRYDVSDLIGRPFTENIYDSAKGCYEQFRLRYPEDAAKLNIDANLKKIDEQAADNDYYTAKYYQKAGNRQAANLYCGMVVNSWPGTEAARLANEMLAENLTGQAKESDE